MISPPPPTLVWLWGLRSHFGTLFLPTSLSPGYVAYESQQSQDLWQKLNHPGKLPGVSHAWNLLDVLLLSSSFEQLSVCPFVQGFFRHHCPSTSHRNISSSCFLGRSSDSHDSTFILSLLDESPGVVCCFTNPGISLGMFCNIGTMWALYVNQTELRAACWKPVCHETYLTHHQLWNVQAFLAFIRNSLLEAFSFLTARHRGSCLSIWSFLWKPSLVGTKNKHQWISDTASGFWWPDLSYYPFQINSNISGWAKNNFKHGAFMGSIPPPPVRGFAHFCNFIQISLTWKILFHSMTNKLPHFRMPQNQHSQHSFQVPQFFHRGCLALYPGRCYQ